MNIKVQVKSVDYLRVCGYSIKDSMKNIIFFLDVNATTAVSRNVLPLKSIPWKQRKYVGDECTLLSGLPVGQHVLSLVCVNEGETCAFSHLVEYE